MGDFSRRLPAPTPQPMNMSNSVNLQMSPSLKPVITMDHIADIKCPVVSGQMNIYVVFHTLVVNGKEFPFSSEIKVFYFSSRSVQ